MNFSNIIIINNKSYKNIKLNFLPLILVNLYNYMKNIFPSRITFLYECTLNTFHANLSILLPHTCARRIKIREITCKLERKDELIHR